MNPPPLSGRALRALVTAAESSLTGDLVMEVLRKESGIAELLAVPTDASDELTADQRPLPSIVPGSASGSTSGSTSGSASGGAL